ncbi:MlaE family ABC transporter permease [Pacificimonas flava]|uniref:ABC transporter, inner membrane subunit n=1 Tax=Pacificimonas flava TaxID=1234595 RepID=M2SBG1_9SPHN|nr:ABC transporter permease [Pacificimonas flava]EMD82715.1 ABC transporter, inner membrane subunit [Pacificimonas flava]MBB5279334.1 phospholipid/cholesterol/gamma-HCH transport system permease protein [Pacificimonas flava]
MTDSFTRLFAPIGAAALSFFAAIGRAAIFAGRALLAAVRPPYYPARFVQQLLSIGYFSLPVVGLTALFTGAALAQQIYVGGERFNAASTVPAVTVIAIVRELAPVLGGLMVAGRVSSAMAAELGTMRVTEQIDALVTLRTDPFQFLVAPRLLAAIVVLPILTLVANAIGVMGGYLLAVYRLGFNAASYLETTRDYLEVTDIVSSLVKAAVFGFVLALMGCYHGYHTSGGAAGVGRATTNAVVSAFLLILLANLVITVLVFG